MADLVGARTHHEDKQELMTNNVVGLIEFRVDIILVNRKNDGWTLLAAREQ